MKLLFVAVRFHSNQVPLVRALVADGHEVRFDVLFEGKSEDHSLVEPQVMPLAPRAERKLQRDAPVNPAAYLAEHAFPSLGWYLRRFREVDPDVIVVRDPNRPFGWRAALAARMLGKRVVLYTQGDVHGRPGLVPRWVRAAMIGALDAVWFSPVPGDRELPKVHPDVHYLPFAADLDRPVKAEWFREDQVHLLDIGKFRPRKNHLLLLDAVERVRREHDVRLTIVGEVSTEEHRTHHAEVVERIDRLGLGDVVTVRTNVPFAEIGELYVRHDLFVLPSRREPASVSVLEAMAHGLPVMCSTTSGTRWYVEPGRTGFVFASDDVDDLVAKLTTAVAERGTLIAMGVAARTVAETVHAPESVAADLLAMIHRWRKRT